MGFKGKGFETPSDFTREVRSRKSENQAKQARKSERKAAYTASHQNTPTEEAPSSNFEEELKRRRTGGAMGGNGGYGGNTKLG